jgi:hypothetical protein
MVCAKCRNPDCSHKSFALPIPGIERYQRATRTLISKAVAGVVQDNSNLKRIAQRLSRSLNTTGSQATLHRWKQCLASKYNFPEILNQLQFSGVLSIDEYMPQRGGRYEQFAGDAIKRRILYIEPVPWLYGRGVIEKFLRSSMVGVSIPTALSLTSGPPSLKLFVRSGHKPPFKTITSTSCNGSGNTSKMP